MANEKTRVNVTINNQNYTVLTEESSEYIQYIAHAVDHKFQEINRANSGLDTTRKAMLTALNIMDEYEKLNQRYKILNEKYRQVQSQIESQG
ncbi:cell division protein ZapA [Aliicoccus persicus]|uniref:Cell division protein ZapA n=1 Tax=Aliicoccus persicus TaxID=930138 RepID=A0A662Z120_9STAP|nr:cell division protein ZapA [Aliicoccus persicus]SEV82280.1 cell division protein ZapA [Aliicoccus persicus]